MTKRRPTTRKTAFFNRRRTPHLEILENRRLLTASSESPNVAISSINQYGTVLFGQDWQDDLGINAAQIQQHIQADTWRSALNDSSAATISQIRQEAQYLGAETLQAQIDGALEAANLPTIDVREFDWLQERNVGPAVQADYFADGEILDEMLAEGEAGTERKFYIKYQQYSTFEGHLTNPGQNSTLTIHIGYTGDYVEGGFSVGWNATNGTASAGSDFTPASGTVNFTDTAEGEQPVNFTIINDTIDELDETFTVQVGSPDGARGSTEVTIFENDLHVAIFDADPVTEEDEATPWVSQLPQSSFRVTISSPRSEAVSIPWRSTVAAPPYSAEQLALLGPDYYHPTSGVPDVHHWVTFNPGETEKFIEIGVVGDRLYELTEHYYVDIATDWLHHIQYTVDDQRATGTIIDNDPFPELAINDVSVEESDGTATLTVTMTNRSSFPVTFDWTLADQSATRPEDYDYNAASGTVTIPSGGGPDPHLEHFTFEIIDDFLTEHDETFRLTISNAVNANITKATGVVTILANDPQVDIDADSNNNGAITEADDPIEMIPPGKIVRLNNDDDNGNGTADSSETGPVNGENDLTMTLLRANVPPTNTQQWDGYTVLLSISGPIRVWSSPDKGQEIHDGTVWPYDNLPSEVYVEGTGNGQASALLVLRDQDVNFVHFDSVGYTVTTLDVDIDSDNNNGVAFPDGSAWEEFLEINPYGLGKLIMLDNPTRPVTPILLKLGPGLNPNDHSLAIRLDWNPVGQAGQLRIWDTPVIDEFRNQADVSNGGDRVFPGELYSLDDLNYDPATGLIVVYAEGISENVNIKKLAGVEQNNKPDERVRATLIASGNDVIFDEVKYIVANEDSFFYDLQTRQEVRAELASRGVYNREDMPNFSLRPLSVGEVADLGVQNAGLLGPASGVAGFNAALYQDYITGPFQYAVAFAGTDDNVAEGVWDDWVNNIAQGLGRFAPQYEAAMQVGDALKDATNLQNSNLIATGHSLGGGLASAASVVGNAIPAHTFNAAGLHENTLYDRTVGGELIVNAAGQYVELYPGSVANYLAAANFIDAWYMDWDILSTIQTTSIPDAIGDRHMLDGPYDGTMLLVNPFGYIHQSFQTPWAIMSGGIPGLIIMLESHKHPSILYGLLVQEGLYEYTILRDTLGIGSYFSWQ